MLRLVRFCLYLACLVGMVSVASQTVSAADTSGGSKVKAKTELFPKRSHCVVWLSPTMDDGWNNERVDWAAVRKNLLTLGYPDRIASIKLNELTFYRGQAPAQIREAIGDKKWNGIRPLTESDYKKILADHDLAEQILASLPLWSGFKGFDPAAFVAHSLTEGTYWQKTFDGIDDFFLWVPLWTRGPLAVSSVKYFLSATEAPVSLPWLLSFFSNPDDRTQITHAHVQDISARLQKSESGDDALIVSAATQLPMALWPPDLQRVVGERIDLKNYPPVTMNGVGICERGYQDAGDCQIMTKAHLDTLGIFPKKYMEEGVWRSTILIRVNGVLVGAIKKEGDPSMLALRNVTNADGQLVLMMGATYHLSKDLYALIDAQFARKPRHRWIGVDLDHLTVHPNSILLNQRGWPNLYKDEILELMRGQLSADGLSEREAGYYGPPSLRITQMVRGEILRQIDLLRQRFEP